MSSKMTTYTISRKLQQSRANLKTQLQGTEESKKSPRGIKKSKDFIHSRTFECQFNASLYMYIMDQALTSISTDRLTLESRASDGIQLGLEEDASVNILGIILYVIEEKILNMSTEYGVIKLSSNYDFSDLIKSIENEFSKRNPLNKFLLLGRGAYEEFFLRPVPSLDVSFDEIIIKDSLKEELLDNVIFNLKELDDHNGIILFGSPGVGKSLVCKALSQEAKKMNIGTIVYPYSPNYQLLQEYLTNFCERILLVFEDINTIGDEDSGVKWEISQFLQFLNGVYDNTCKTVSIATTNDIENLSNAIKNRPVRFNRLLKFDYPDQDLIKELCKFYLKDDGEMVFKILENRNKDLEKLKLTGAHIKEIDRTARMLSKKSGKQKKEVLEESVNKVLDSFVVNVKNLSVGFEVENKK